MQIYRVLMNEFSEGERISREGFIRQNYEDEKEEVLSTFESVLLLKYIRATNNHWGKKKLTKALVDFIKERKAFFNEFDDNSWKWINKCVRRAMTREIMITKEISVTKNELKVISSIPSIKQQKFIFVALVLSKINFDHTLQWIISKGGEPFFYCYFQLWWLHQITKLAKISMSKDKFFEFFRYLNDRKLIHQTEGKHNFYTGKDSSPKFQLLFAEEEGEPVITITSLDNLIEQYKPICPECEQIIEQPTNHSNLCKNCYRAKRKEDIRLNVQNFRAKQSV
jgi:hypothetical protein